jgi:DNA-binding MarR family transcriptional regulator
MEQYLIEFVDTLDQSLKELQRQVGSGAGFSSLTINQFHYLDAISRLREPTLTEIAEKMNISKASVTVGINKLIKLGFVQKIRSSEDRRVFHVCLTQDAQDLVEARFQALHEYGQFIQSALSEEEARQFQAAIMKITQLFKEKESSSSQTTGQPGVQIEG